MMNIGPEWVVAIATAAGVAGGLLGLYFTVRLNRVKFEDSMDKEYRRIIAKIPLDALLDESVQGGRGELRERIYNYFDLCNAQIYLRMIGRVSKRRWKGWMEGIEDHLYKREFCRVWKEVKPKGMLSYLKCLDKNFRNRRNNEAYQLDPRRWRKGCVEEACCIAPESCSSNERESQ